MKVALTAVALHTTTIQLGTMLTPITRRRPWQLARQTASLDRLSNGRLILWSGNYFHYQGQHYRAMIPPKRLTL